MYQEQSGVTPRTKTVKLRVTDIDRLSELKLEEHESPASVLTRILDEYIMYARLIGAIRAVVLHEVNLQ